MFFFIYFFNFYFLVWGADGSNGPNLEDTVNSESFWISLLSCYHTKKSSALEIVVPEKGGAPRFRARTEMPCSETEQSNYKMNEK